MLRRGIEIMKEKLQLCFNTIRGFIVWIFPLALFAVGGLLFVDILGKDTATYISLLKITVWPVTTLIILFFFRKVVTYLFFSMTEYNFFGNKGVLKDITEVIEERVEERLENEKSEVRHKAELEEKEAAIKKAVQSGKTQEEKAKELQRITTEILGLYKEASEKHNSALKELNFLRDKEQKRQERMIQIREEIQKQAKQQVQEEPTLDPEKARPEPPDHPKQERRS